MLLSDLALARRLERTEGRACVAFAEAHLRVSPECRAEWIECDGALAVFDGSDSPITQTFGLGVFQDLTAEALDRLEIFFGERGAQVMHEISPLAGIAALELLCLRNYRPIELSSVLYLPLENNHPAETVPDPDVRVRIIESGEAELWADVSARGWSHEQPELLGFLLGLGKIFCARENTVCYLAEHGGVPGAAGALCIHDGVALFGGACTVPELRRRGLQSALMTERLRHARERGCDLAMMVAVAGSDSQRNAERQGFRIAYTRTKWQQFPMRPAAA